jgi:hypothetical protein
MFKSQDPQERTKRGDHKADSRTYIQVTGSTRENQARASRSRQPHMHSHRMIHNSASEEQKALVWKRSEPQRSRVGDLSASETTKARQRALGNGVAALLARREGALSSLPQRDSQSIHRPGDRQIAKAAVLVASDFPAELTQKHRHECLHKSVGKLLSWTIVRTAAKRQRWAGCRLAGEPALDAKSKGVRKDLRISAHGVTVAQERMQRNVQVGERNHVKDAIICGDAEAGKNSVGRRFAKT